MKEDYDIVLRGHHLKLLYQFYCLKKENKIRKSMLHLHYGQGHTDHAINVLKRIAESDIKVKITDTLDVICSKCYWRVIPDICGQDIEDVEMALYLGLKTGKTYNSKFILRKLEEEHKKRKHGGKT